MKLTNIRLVNWHIFSDHIIHIDGNVVLTGENGHGKSTVIDALFFILSGGEDNYFNNAANAKSARTLETYIRGKLGIEGNKYLRSASDVTAHIALEFTDEYSEKKKILGCVLSLTGSKANKRFYIIDNIDIETIPYVNKETKEVIDFAGLQEFCKSSFDAFKQNEGVKGVRNKIGALMGLSDMERYYSLLKKGVAFSPLDENTTTFVNNFLLKEDKLDISNLRGQINGYRALQNELNSQKAKLETLESFINEGQEYLNNSKAIKYLEAIKYKKDIVKSNKSLANKEKEKTSLNNKMVANSKLITNSDNKISEIEKTLYNLENSDAYRAIKENESALNFKKVALQNLEAQEQHIIENVSLEQNISDELAMDYDFMKLLEAKDITKLNKLLNEFAKDVKSTKTDENERKVKLSIDVNDLEDQISKNEAAIEALKQGINNYDDQITRLINILKYNLKEKYLKDINVSPLCECFEILDSRWRNAIEGYIGPQKFDLIVNDAYFNDAINIYHDKAKDISTIGIIDTTKKEDLPILENSLFTKIKVNNPLAETKLRQLLGGVICVDDVNDLNTYNAAITDDCMLYKNYVVKRISYKRYAKHFIGADSFKQRITILKEELEELKSRRKELKDDLNEAINIIEVLEQSRFKEHDQIENIYFEINEVSNRILELTNLIEELKQNDDFIGMKDEIDSLKIQLRDARKQNEEAHANDRDYAEQLGAIKTEIASLNEVLDYANKEYDFIIKRYEFGNDYYAYEESILANSKSEPDKLRRELEAKNNRNLAKIQKGMDAYYHDFESNLGHSIDDLPKYIATYNKIKQYNVVAFTEKAKEAYDNAKKSFNENFVTSLREKINTAKANIAAINDVLKKHPFSNDQEIYRFVFDASKDKNMNDYYRIITSNTMMGEEVDLLVDAMPEKDQQIIKDLFEKVACDSSDTRAMQTLESLLDYRCYMSFDIEISNKYNQRYRFSEIAKEKSGGETQTPFYVVIAACFEELFKKTAFNSSCIIVYDEAFNNMDETRISTLLDYYHSLNHIQFMIVVPTNRAPYLTPSMDLTIGLIKQNNYVNLKYIGKNK